MTREEGYIKFKCLLVGEDFNFSKDQFLLIENWRERFYKLNLIGAYPNGIGFGNISIRFKEGNNFIISGSATGNYKHLKMEHYALVTDFSINENSLSYIGRVKASSESLSHAVIYETSDLINGIIHVHSKLLWDRLIDKIPTTNQLVTYGTPEMAMELKKTLLNNKLESGGIIVMGGHEEGIISFGKDLKSAAKLLLDKRKEVLIG